MCFPAAVLPMVRLGAANVSLAFTLVALLIGQRSQVDREQGDPISALLFIAVLQSCR